MLHKILTVFFVLLIVVPQFCTPAYADKAQENNLFSASRNGDVEEVKRLLAAGVKINAESRAGEQAIHYAAQNGKTEVVKVLLAGGAKVDAVDKLGYQPIHHAAQSGNTELVQFLLQSGAKVDAMVDASNKYGGQPIHFASQSGNAELVKILLAAGARADAKDSSGDTPYKWISNKGDPESVRNVLLAAGAKPVPTALEELESKMKPVWLEVVSPQIRLGVWDKMMLKKSFIAKYIVKCGTGSIFEAKKVATTGDPPESWEVVFPKDFHDSAKGLESHQAYGCGENKDGQKLTWAIYADDVLIDNGTMIATRKGHTE